MNESARHSDAILRVLVARRTTDTACTQDNMPRGIRKNGSVGRQEARRWSARQPHTAYEGPSTAPSFPTGVPAKQWCPDAGSRSRRPLPKMSKREGAVDAALVLDELPVFRGRRPDDGVRKEKAERKHAEQDRKHSSRKIVDGLCNAWLGRKFVGKQLRPAEPSEHGRHGP